MHTLETHETHVPSQKTENAYVERTAFIYFANVYVVLIKIASESKSEKSFLHTQIDSICNFILTNSTHFRI